VIRVPYISCALVLAISACGGRDPVDEQAAKPSALPEVNAPAASAAGEPRGGTASDMATPVPSARIPAALQGRWGLSPADCTAALSNAKGLLVINADELRFYESRAVPTADVASDGNSISGNFDFAGEGRSWTRYEALKLQNNVLTRTEIKPIASFSYAKCT
jgi:hypothetical protein